MSALEDKMTRHCYSSSVRKVVIAAILLLILEVNMIAIYTYTMVDESDLSDSPEKENIVVRVKRDYLNTVTESTFSNIIASVKHSLHLADQDKKVDVGSGDDQLSDEEGSMEDSLDNNNTKKAPLEIARRVLPSAYIIGVKEGGTKEFLKLLNRHPQIATTMSSRYFRDDKVFRKGEKWYTKSLPKVIKNVKLVECDENLFSTTPAIFRLKRINPLAKLIVILRDPLERTLADFLTIHKGLEGSGYQSYETSFVHKDFSTNEKSSIIRGSMYDVHLRNWLSKFNTSQILLLDYSLVMTKPHIIMDMVEKFLKIQPFYHKERFTAISNDTLCTIVTNPKESRVCLTQDNPDLILPIEIEDTLKAFFTRHINAFWKILSVSRITSSKLVSLVT